MASSHSYQHTGWIASCLHMLYFKKTQYKLLMPKPSPENHLTQPFAFVPYSTPLCAHSPGQKFPAARQALSAKGIYPHLPLIPPVTRFHTPRMLPGRSSQNGLFHPLQKSASTHCLRKSWNRCLTHPRWRTAACSLPTYLF